MQLGLDSRAFRGNIYFLKKGPRHYPRSSNERVCIHYLKKFQILQYLRHRISCPRGFGHQKPHPQVLGTRPLQLLSG